jgi:rRNA biogenesis protein RRP5
MSISASRDTAAHLYIMAPVKRKVGENLNSSLPATKRVRIDTKDDSTAPKNRKETDKENVKPARSETRSQPASILKAEQPAFPRGGAGLLTPLEKKQIQAKATRDAIAEHKREKDLFGSSSKPAVEDSEAEGFPSDADDLTQKSSKKTLTKKKRQATDGDLHEPGVRTESLTFKQLTVGSLVLGRVSRINFRDLTIALPNNLTGTVPLTSISTALTKNIEALLAKEPTERDEVEEEENLDLHEYFSIGQWLRVCVSALGEEGATAKGHGKKNIELSLESQSTNVGLELSNVVAGCTIQCSVTSVEDHGVAVDLGLAKGKATGFIPKKELSDYPEWSNIKVGSVMLCVVTEVTSNGRLVKLSANRSRLGNTKVSTLKMAPTIDSFLSGTAVEVLLTEVGLTGLVGQVMGMLDVTADLLHSGAYESDRDLQTRYAIGKKVKGRLLYDLPLSDSRKMGFSILNDVLTLEDSNNQMEKQKSYQISEIVPEASVVSVEPRLGLYLTLAPGVQGFAHISRLADNKVDSISDQSGPYKIGTKHKVRILEYNSVDNLFLVSLQPKVLAQPFLRLEDVSVGMKVSGKIEKLLIGPAGITSLLVNLADGITGLVPRMHFSDVVLQHPEKKFREGGSVTARVLSTDLVKQQIRLTLKKSLVNSDQKIWKDFAEIVVGDASPGTLVKVDTYGAIVHFYGSVKGFLPVSEMSEAYIKDATQHFRVGQSLTVHAMSVTPETGRMTVSCREPTSSNQSIETTLASLVAGTLVSGKVFEKSEDDLLLRLKESGVIARLPIDHISDGSLKKRKSALAKIRVGQDLQDLLVLEARAKQRIVIVSNRSSLLKASDDGSLLKSFDNLKEGATVTGLVSNITRDGIFVSFANGISGLIPKTQVPIESEAVADFGVVLLQPIAAKVSLIDYRNSPPRFWLTMREGTAAPEVSPVKTNGASQDSGNLIDPVDASLKSLSDLKVGKITKARIVSVKDTQINVELAKGLQGRIDVSAIFEDWDEIKDRKRPLHTFSAKQVVDVKVLGAHDARNHRFLPLTHRIGKTPVLELSAKAKDIKQPTREEVKLENVKPGSSWLAFVNNIGDDCLWVNISPNVRGRIRSVDVSDDLSLATDLEVNFPVGSALRVRVVSVDAERNRLDLSAKQGDPTAQVTFKDISKGTIIPGRITKVSDRQLLIQISETVVGAVDLIDMADDFTEVNPAKYQKNDVIRVYVLDVDIPNKKLSLSLRPSKVLSSSLSVADPEVTSIQQLNVNDVVRGFITNVADSGLFVTLGHKVTAHVRVSNLSDSFLKDWKDQFQRDQIVQGKLVSVDKSTGHVQMSLKQSVLDVNYKPPKTFTDMQVGDIVTGKIAKVETFGVFILVDSTENVRGLCHRSEIADKRIEDASKLFSEGDVVKAKILKIEVDKRRINFGMKASYFRDDDNEDEDEVDGSNEEMDDIVEGGAALSSDTDINDDSDDTSNDESVDEMAKSDDSDEDMIDEDAGPISTTAKPAPALTVGGFDWYGLSNESKDTSKRSASPSDNEIAAPTPKRKRKPEIQIDQTGDLTTTPQVAQDFDRLLGNKPESSSLWLQYIAHHLTLGDVDTARSIGERALKSIPMVNEPEKLNIWVALLNLENAYGDDESQQVMLERACEVNDAQTIYERLSSIYVQSGKTEKADELFQVMLKKFGRNDPKLWINYATFFFDTAKEPEKGRALLPRALQTLPQFTHFDVTSKFAQLEFKSPQGLPERGRTIFEGLISSFPKRVDLFNVLLDLETNQGEKEQVRALFERIFAGKVKAKQARFFFKRWLEFEEKEGDEKSVDAVKLRAADWVKNLKQAE